MNCRYFTNGTCDIASRLAGELVMIPPNACNTCRDCFVPFSENYVTASLAIHHFTKRGEHAAATELRERLQARGLTDSAPIEVPCRSIHDLLVDLGVNVIDLLKVDAEGSEVEIFSCLAAHRWLPKTCWIRFEWHGRESIPHLRRLLSPTHEVSIEEDGLWNALGIAHRKEIHDGVEC